MKNQAFVRAAAAVLATALLGSGAALAQTDDTPTLRIETSPRIDTAPPPAEERGSLGAVLLVDQPVLAQRQQMLNMARSTPDTRTMGAGPARVMQREADREDAFKQKLIEALQFYRGGATDPQN